MHIFNIFDFSDISYLHKRKGVGFSWVKAAKGGSLKVYAVSVLNLCSDHNTDYHSRPNRWYACDFY